MTHIAFTPRLKATPSRGALGVKSDLYEPQRHLEIPDPEFVDSEKDTFERKKPKGETLEKVVKRIPTFYVIIFFSVFTACAVLIIWNTLQVNRLTYDKSRLEGKIEQTKQRIIKLKAQEMQLSAPERIREIAKGKFGMQEANGIDEFTIQ
ncbi:MAG: cell division protein FtsL [Bacteroidota bacterium]|nr:cell division protein FtsL [Bacteroidota bacterium]MDP4228819.1 cell division protein FtsL [Bacteroidota bacterium]